MKIALFGAGGHIGRQIAAEALARGHQVEAVVRDPRKLTLPGVAVREGDATDAASVARAVAGQDAAIDAVGARLPDGDPQVVVRAVQGLVAGLEQARVARLLVVGGAGSLEVAPGVQVVDTPEFPAAWKPVALAHRDALALLRQNATLDWTYLSPAALIEPGPRTGVYRLGGDQLLTDENGASRISIADYAKALIDELETPRHVRQRMTVAY
jgi:uncharacterized protein